MKGNKQRKTKEDCGKPGMLSRLGCEGENVYQLLKYVVQLEYFTEGHKLEQQPWLFFSLRDNLKMWFLFVKEGQEMYHTFYHDMLHICCTTN